MIGGAFLLAVAIVAHKPGYCTSMAVHLQRWLKTEHVSARVVTPTAMSKVLPSERMAFLVGFETPTAAELQTLRAFRARGGRLVVMHSGSAALGEMMGVQPIGYKTAAYPGQWSRMAFQPGQIPGAPTAILQTSTALQRAVPLNGRSRVVATWMDRAGRQTGDAAWLASSAGFWMTHMLLPDGDENLKAQLLGALVGTVDSRAWNFQAHRAREGAKAAATREYALRQVPRPGEIHAVWDHTGCGLYPGNWPATIRLLKSSGVTDLFVNVAGAGFAHYPSGVLSRSRTFAQEGDQLAACLTAAKGTGLRVHAWILCFSATRGQPAVLETFRKRGWRLRSTGGALTEYLDPSNPAVRAHVLSAISEIQAHYPVSGIHLDFVRWGDSAVKPKGAAQAVSQFVADARRLVKRPRWLTAAVYGKYPNCVATVGQDWNAWLNLNLVDYVVPMDYTEDAAKFAALLAQQSATRAHAARTIVGIGVTANESRLDARKVIDQVNQTRRLGFAGVSLFDLDTTLEKQILPYLRLGLWIK